MTEDLSSTSLEMLKTTLKRFIIVVIFGIAFAYIEAAVVVYLRTIFHPDGFTFPLTQFAADSLSQRILLTEIGRETATLVIILTGAWLVGLPGQRLAFFLTIFAVWDIFYYVWLKILLNWPASIMDWDVLFLIPVMWASPVLAPVLVSLAMLIFAGLILYRSSLAKTPRATPLDVLGFILAAAVVVTSFCIAGLHAAEPDFQAYFSWPLFAIGYLSAIGLFLKCLLKSK